MNQLIKAIFYKEWIKCHKLFIASTLLILIPLFSNYSKIQNIIQNISQKYFWHLLTFSNYNAFKYLFIWPYLFAILLAFFQFYPERNKYRIRISYALPYTKSRVFYTHLIFGNTLILAFQIIMLIESWFLGGILTGINSFLLFTIDWITTFLLTSAIYIWISIMIFEINLKRIAAQIFVILPVIVPFFYRIGIGATENILLWAGLYLAISYLSIIYFIQGHNNFKI